MKNFALGCAINLEDLFINFDNKKLKTTCKQCLELVHEEHKDVLVRKVFKDAFKIVAIDAIENNVTFELPLGSKKANIHVTKVSENDFVKARQKGAFKKVDYLASNFSGNQLTYNYNTISKNIYLNKDLRERLVNYTNQGKQYC